MKVQPVTTDIFQKGILSLGILAGLSLFGYALVNLIRMPAVSPDAFVPFLWLNSKAAVVCLAVSVFCLVPIPILFGKMAVE